jgi:hypothetical protein
MSMVPHRCRCQMDLPSEGATGWSVTGPENQGEPKTQGFDSSTLRQLAKDLVLELWEEHQPLRMYDIAERYLRAARDLEPTMGGTATPAAGGTGEAEAPGDIYRDP